MFLLLRVLDSLHRNCWQLHWSSASIYVSLLEVNLYLYDGALPGGYGVRGGVSLPGGLGQDRHGAEAAPPPALLRHLVVAGVKVFLALAQPLLQEGRVAAAPRARPPAHRCNRQPLVWC